MVIEWLPFTQQSIDQAVAFMRQVDEFFCPPIASRVNLTEYATKLLSEGYVISCIEEPHGFQLGLAGFYCNPEMYEFGFLSYIASNGRRKGVGSVLLQSVIGYCRQHGSKGVDTQTWLSNSKSQQLLERHGFRAVNRVSNRQNDDPSVLLRLEFNRDL